MTMLSTQRGITLNLKQQCQIVIKKIQLPCKHAVRAFATVSLGHHCIRTVVFEIPSKKDSDSTVTVLDDLIFCLPWCPRYRHGDITISHARTKVVLAKALLSVRETSDKVVEVTLLSPRRTKVGVCELEMQFLSQDHNIGARLLRKGEDTEELGYTSEADGSYTARSAPSERQFVLSKLLSNIQTMRDEHLPPIESLYPGTKAVTQVGITVAARLERARDCSSQPPKLYAIIGSTPSISTVRLGLSEVEAAEEAAEECIFLSSQSVTLDYESNLGLDVSFYEGNDCNGIVASRNVDVSNIVAHRIPVVDIPLTPIRDIKGYQALYYIRIECLYEGLTSFTNGRFWQDGGAIGASPTTASGAAAGASPTTASAGSSPNGSEFTHEPFLADQLAQKLDMRLPQTNYTTVELDLLEVSAITLAEEQSPTDLNLLVVIEIGKVKIPLDSLVIGVKDSKRIGYRLQVPYHGEAFALVLIYHRPTEYLNSGSPKHLYCYDKPVGCSFVNLEPCVLHKGGAMKKLYKIRRRFPSNVVCGYLKIQSKMKEGTIMTPSPAAAPPPAKRTVRIVGIISRAHPQHPGHVSGLTVPLMDTDHPYSAMVITLEREYNIQVWWADKGPKPSAPIEVPADGSPVLLFITPDNMLSVSKPTSRVSATLSGHDAGAGIVPLIETSPFGQKVKSFPFFVQYTVS